MCKPNYRAGDLVEKVDHRHVEPEPFKRALRLYVVALALAVLALVAAVVAR